MNRIFIRMPHDCEKRKGNLNTVLTISLAFVFFIFFFSCVIYKEGPSRLPRKTRIAVPVSINESDLFFRIN